MNFWGFLQWLWGKATRAFAILGYLYDKVRDAALFAWSWARQAYRDAKQWAEKKWNELKNWAATEFNKARTWVNQQISTFSGNIFKQIQVWFGQVKTKVLEWIAEKTQEVQEWASRTFSPLIDKLSGKLKEFKDRITGKVLSNYDMIRRLSKYNDLLDSLSSLTSPTTLTQINDFFRSFYWSVVSFFQNPIGFLASIWQAYLLEFLGFALAYALGTEEATLPPWPNWGTGDFDYKPPPPPPGELPNRLPAKPLSDIYISGYPFTSTHKGVDLGAVLGQAVYATHNGIVTFAGWSPIGYGMTITIEGDGWWTRYAHLSSLLVTRGMKVKAGEQIGKTGSTGNSTGPHLHFEVKWKGEFINPILVLR